MIERESRKPKIVVVDDNPLNQMLLEEILVGAGYEVCCFFSGESALEVLREEEADLILLDVVMPGMSGYEMCRRLKKLEGMEGIPVIFCSALTHTEEKVSAFSEGGVDYVTKPFDPAEVLARVGTHIKLASLQRCLSQQNEGLEEMVARRTQELAAANERLLELDRLKNEFLLMISHEILTPVNGIFGIGEVILEELSSTAVAKTYREAFGQSLQRLRDLIDDAGMIAGVEKMRVRVGEEVILKDFLERMAGEFGEKNRVEGEFGEGEEVIYLNVDRRLLSKAMKTAFKIAECFLGGGEGMVVSYRREEDGVNIYFPLRRLGMGEEQAESFFRLDSTARVSSYAESLGLAPVVAKKILNAFGGDLRLVCEGTGILVVRIPICGGV